MSQTIFWKAFPLTVFDSVYKPREDSFLLAEVMEKETGQGKNALDLGCGCGLQGIVLALNGFRVLAVDKNHKATENSLFNAQKLKLESIQGRESNLFSSVKEKFDLIAFNPPYTLSKMIKDERVEGGRKGREILDQFLEETPEHLKEKGSCFFLQSSLNGVKETGKKLKEQGLNFKIAARKKLFFEELLVFQCWKK